MAKLDPNLIMNVASSGEAAKVAYQFLRDLRFDVLSALSGDTTLYHLAVGPLAIEADATEEADAIVLANELRGLIVAHLASEGDGRGVHAKASAAKVTAPAATDLATANALATELKADFNTHLTEAGVHLRSDSTNTVTGAAATDETTLVALVNDIKACYNAHVVKAIASKAEY